MLLDRLVYAGATVVVVEHNTDIIRSADWVIDLGPGAGPAGGQVLYAGPAGDLLQSGVSLTAKALRDEEQVVPKIAQDAPADLVADAIRIRAVCATTSMQSTWTSPGVSLQ